MPHSLRGYPAAAHDRRPPVRGQPGRPRWPPRSPASEGLDGSRRARFDSATVPVTTNEITLRLADSELTQLLDITKSLAERVEFLETRAQRHDQRITACEDAETELAQDVSAHAGRLLALETPRPRASYMHMHLPAGGASEDWNFGPDHLLRTLEKLTVQAVEPVERAADDAGVTLRHPAPVRLKRDAVDALLREMETRIGALQWDQPGPDTDERRGFREGAAWALNVAREMRP